MVEWSHSGIIVGRKPLSEKDAALMIFTENSGIISGVLKNRMQKKHQALQLGDCVSATWRARLPEHMGTWQVEPLKSYGAISLGARSEMEVFSLILDMCRFFLPERHPYNDLYEKLTLFLAALLQGDEWLYLYVLFELHLLHDMGFGLKLDKCAVTGTTEGLMYASPKTGRAVSEKVGLPYQDKLLALPAFLFQNKAEKNLLEIKKGLSITGHFLETLFHDKRYVPLFDKRKRFIKNL